MASAKVKITGIPGVRRSVRETFDKVRTDKALLSELAEQLQADVLGSARSGKSPGGKVFPSLSTSWQKSREYLKRYNSTGEFYLGSSKSNLTFTGKFLESIVAKVFPSEGLVSVEPSGRHPGYKTGSGKTKSVDNKKLSNYLSDMGFEFLFVSKAFRKRTVVTVKRFLRRIILQNK